MSTMKLPNPFEGDPQANEVMDKLLLEVVSDYEPKWGPDFFHRRIRKFTAAEKRDMKARLDPYVAEGWARSAKARSALNVLASMRVEGVDISSVVDAIELSITDADDDKHQDLLFQKLSNLILYLLSPHQVEDLERFFSIRYSALDRWQQFVFNSAVRKKWFREDPRFAYLADDDRFFEETRAKLKTD